MMKEFYNDLGEHVPETWPRTRLERVAQAIHEHVECRSTSRSDWFDAAKEAIKQADRGFERHRAASREESKRFFEDLKRKNG